MNDQTLTLSGSVVVSRSIQIIAAISMFTPVSGAAVPVKIVKLFTVLPVFLRQ